MTRFLQPVLQSLIVLLAMPSLAPADEFQSLRIPPQEPLAAQKSFITKDGFRMELLAAEPLVMDPVAMEYDEFGRAFVVEMSDYPYTDRSKDKPFTDKSDDAPIGRIRVLLDDNRDGRFDRSTIFAEGLSWPTGLAFWKGGVYVAATPEILYFRDTDGDFRADERRAVFAGFRKFNIQAVMNNLRWSLDHQIYGAGGTNGGTITRLADSNAVPLKMTSQDFRFHPETENFELISGGARFGQTFDDAGNRFLCNIRNPIRQLVYDDRYLARNPFSGLMAPVHDAAASGDTVPIYRMSQPEPWRTLNAGRLAADRMSVSPRSETVAAGFVTSACGVTVYRGSAYPDKYYGQMFLGEVAANVVHRQKLIPEGMTFRAERMDERSEFVSSTDNWFRPVNFINAPDGTLHVLDMYRETIEHPWSIPDDLKARLDLENGRDRGRIYRLQPPDFDFTKRIRETTTFPGNASTAELVAMLSHPDGWWRETSHRLLFERQDLSAVPLLRNLLVAASDAASAEKRELSVQSQRSSAFGKVLALWSLQGLHSLKPDDLLITVRDPSDIVREHAIRLVEPFLRENAELRAAVIAAAHDDASRVRCQAAFSLGSVPDESVIPALVSVAIRDDRDPWQRAAILTADPALMTPVAVHILTHRLGSSEPPVQTLRGLIAAITERGDKEELATILHSAGQCSQHQSAQTAMVCQRAVLLGICDRLRRRSTSLSEFVRSAAAEEISWVETLMQQASRTALDDSLLLEERIQSIQLLGYSDYSECSLPLLSLLTPAQPQSIQFAAVTAISATGHDQVPTELLARWKSLTPPTRVEVVQQLMSRPAWIPTVLNALESVPQNATLSITDIPIARRSLLLKHADPVIRKRAEQVFGKEPLSNRTAVVNDYQVALTMSGNAERGREIAKKACLTCHRLNGTGQDLGPQLETIRHRSPGDILLHILDPNREVSPNFLEYIVLRHDGLTSTGLIVSETPTTITLRRPEGLEETISRKDIESLTTTGRSLMPEGLEKQLTIEAMADLLAALKS
ncbi:MAG: PVC-type heme-binding CxxCH protein [Planctomycetaceae bacterium]